MGIIKVREKVEWGLAEDLYLVELVKGMAITARHAVRNLPLLRNDLVTCEYPEEPAYEYPERYRGRHRLVPHADGSPRCTACFLCATACPANCIYIEAGEREDGLEKYPERYEIDTLRCIVCGLCVEACPCDAIRMDSGEHVHPCQSREDAILDKESLLEGPPSSNKLLVGAPDAERN